MQAGFAAIRFSQYLPLWKDSKQLFTHAINSLPEGVSPNDKAIHNVAIISLDEMTPSIWNAPLCLCLTARLVNWIRTPASRKDTASLGKQRHTAPDRR